MENLIDRIKQFYTDSDTYPLSMKWHKFYFKVRVPIGLIVNIIYMIIYIVNLVRIPSLENKITVILSFIFLGVLYFLLFVVYKRGKHAFKAMCVMLILECISIVGSSTPLYLGIVFSAVWLILNLIYFVKRKDFFDYETMHDQKDENAYVLEESFYSMDIADDQPNQKEESESKSFEADLIDDKLEEDIHIISTDKKKKCEKCGQVLDERYRFCLKCGASAMKKEIQNEDEVKKEVEKKVEIEAEPVNVEEKPIKGNNLSEGIMPVLSDSDMDQIRKWKKLLDEGILTQQEFDQKKKELLHL